VNASYVRQPRVGVACLYHESNTRISRRTTLTDIRRGALSVDRIVCEASGTQTALGGMIDGGREHGFELLPLVYARAIPSGPLDRPAFEALASEFEMTLRAAAPLDGLLLELHGAMTADGHERADAELTAIAREALGTTPIVIVLDPHANLADALVKKADVVLAYQENPHVDMARRGHDAARAMAAILRGDLSATTVARHVPIVAPPIAQASADEPLATLVRAARALEARSEIAFASLFFGFAHADVPDVGMAVVVAAPDPADAAHAAEELAALCWEMRAGFARSLLTPTEAIARAFELKGLTAIADTGDNIGGGAPGDSSVLLRAALNHGRIRLATTIHAPAAVAAASAAGAGSTVHVTLGSPALEATARVLVLCDGAFAHDGPLSSGVQFDMGAVALLEIDRVLVLVQTYPVPPNDQAMFRTAGIDVSTLDCIVLKGAAAIRAGWSSAVSAFLDVSTPGPTTSELDQVSFLRAKRPLWPIDRWTD